MSIRDSLRTVRSFFFIFQSGMISSAVVLLVLWLMAEYWPRVYFIGWYYSFLPVGAIAAGFAAAAGYVLAAMWSDATVARWVMVPIFICQLGTYVAADYVEYRRLSWDADQNSISFVEYFDLRSRSYRLVDGHGNEEPFQGYLLRAFEMIGFAGPGLLVPLFMRGMPRCRRCRGYETTRTWARLLSTPEISFEEWRVAQNPEEVGLHEWEARATYFERHVTELLQPLTEAIDSGQANAVQDILATLIEQSEAVTAPHCIITLNAQYCRACMVGQLRISYRYQEDGMPKYDSLPSIDIGMAVLDAVPVTA